MGRIPTVSPKIAFSISPDGKTLIRPSGDGPASATLQAWDLETGKRSAIPEIPVANALGAWVGPRRTLTSAAAAANTPPRLLLYDLDVHTHTFAYDQVAGYDVCADTLGRAWMKRPGREGYGPVQLPGADGLKRELAFGPGSPIRVEIDACSRDLNPKIARQTAELLQRRGLKIGPGGWTLRADHTVGRHARQFDDRNSGKKYTREFVALTITWKLLAPDGTEVWHGEETGNFDLFRAKSVVVGSRKNEYSGPQGGGYMQVEIDFGNKNPQTAQIEEILETTALYRQGLPAGLPVAVAKGDDYTPLPIHVKLPAGK